MTGSSAAPYVVRGLLGSRVYASQEGRSTGAGAKKLQNLKANPWVALTFDLYSDAWTHLRGVLVQGRARVIERGPRFRKIRSALYRKYPQYPHQAARVGMCR